jgi:hypothetical protein
MPANGVKHTVLNPGFTADRLKGVSPAVVGGDLRIPHDLTGEADQAILHGPPDTANVVTSCGIEEQSRDLSAGRNPRNQVLRGDHEA